MSPSHSLLIGLDVDGVLADLLGPILDAIRDRTGQVFTPDDVVKFDLAEVLGPESFAIAHELLSQPGFARTLPLYPGARQVVERLRHYGRVVFVTSPYANGPTWSSERTEWLTEHFEARRDDVAHLADKTLFAGDVLIDDAPVHLEAWANTGRFAVRVARPWNKGAPGRVAVTWSDVVRLVEDLSLSLCGAAD